MSGPLGRFGNGAAQFLCGHRWDDRALIRANNLIQPWVALGFAQKVAAQGNHHRHLGTGVLGGGKQVVNEGLAFLGVLTEGVDLLKLVYQHHQRGILDLRNQAGDAAQAIVDPFFINQSQLRSKLPRFGNGHWVLGRRFRQHPRQRLQGMTTGHQHRHPHLGLA